MSETHKKSLFSYEEGHRRETRKSYQAFLEEIMDTKIKTEDPSESSEDVGDDSNVRRSKRTPVPKRGFKLIEDYDSKEPSKKKTKLVKEVPTKTSKKTAKSVEQTASKVSVKEEPEDDSAIAEVSQELEDQSRLGKGDLTPSRKSGRARKPKVFEDSIALPYIKKPQLTKNSEATVLSESSDMSDKKNDTNAETKRSKKTSEVKDIESSLLAAAVAAVAEVLSPAETTKLRKKSISTDVSENTPKTVEKKKTVRSSTDNSSSANKTTPQSNASPKKKFVPQNNTSPKKKLASQNEASVKKKPVSQNEASPKIKLPSQIDASPVKTQKGKRKSEQGIAPTNMKIKEEVFTDSSQDSDTSPKKKKTKTYESYVTTGSKKYESPVNVKAEPRDEPDVLASKNVDAKTLSASKAKENIDTKQNKTTDVNKSQKEKGKAASTKATARSKKGGSKTTKQSKEKTKKSEKLVVPVKKNNVSKTSKKLTKNENSSQGEDTLNDSSLTDRATLNDSSLADNSVVMNSSTSNDLPDIPNKEITHKKKTKKKSKKKLDSKHQKVIDVKTFPVTDDIVMKVKKKKIYKKRNGEKILVRIIKNHCNKTGEIVKTETVIVDNVPVDDVEKEDVENIGKESDASFNVSLEEPGEEEKTGNESESKIMSDSEYKPEDEKLTSKKPANKANKLVKKLVVKKSTKVVKKSRPANKNVTVGGKVVGKTTKGMKKTGVAVLEESKTAASETAIAIPDAVTPNSEPKNAYNLFCRKYRPLIVHQHPKADFSEISRRLAALWNAASAAEKQEHREKFYEMQSGRKVKLMKLNRTSPSLWSDVEFKYIKRAISEHESFPIPQYSVKRLQPVDMAAHLQLLGDSLNVIAGALEQQSSMTVHGAMSVLLDSILCALAPLIFLTSHIPEMNAIDEDQQARILDNLAYILPGL